VNDVAVALEHVDLLNLRDGLNVHFLEDGLEFLVVGAGRLVDLLDLPPGCALASILLSVSHIIIFPVSRGSRGRGIGGARLWSLCFHARGSCRQAEFEEDDAERELFLPYTLISSTKPLVY